MKSDEYLLKQFFLKINNLDSTIHLFVELKFLTSLILTVHPRLDTDYSESSFARLFSPIALFSTRSIIDEHSFLFVID